MYKKALLTSVATATAGLGIIYSRAHLSKQPSNSSVVSASNRLAGATSGKALTSVLNKNFLDPQTGLRKEFGSSEVDIIKLKSADTTLTLTQTSDIYKEFSMYVSQNNSIPDDLKQSLSRFDNNDGGYSMLHFMTYIQMLADKNPNGSMKDPTIFNILRSIFDIYKQKGISPNHPNKFSRSPLDYLPLNKHPKFPTDEDIKTFVKEVIELTPSDDQYLDRSIVAFFEIALIYKDKILADFALELIEKRGSLKMWPESGLFANNYGMTLLHLAAKYGASKSTIEKLLKLGLDPTSLDDFGKRPDQYAKDEEVKELLFTAFINAGGK